VSASLIVLIPVVLLGVVTTVCFVGCVLNRQGTGVGPGGPTALYQGAVITNANLVAYWPLNDTQQDLPTAHDLSNHKFDGTYTFGPTGPSSFMIQQAGIVPGDLTDALRNPCASFNGGFVQVPFHQELNASSFTLECWVKPNWTGADPQDQRAAVVSAFGDERPNPTDNAGYGIVATQDNFWSAQIGLGTKFLGATSKDAIMLDGVATYYLAMTFDGSSLTLFVGIVGGALTSTPPVSPAPGEKFVSESPGMTATSLFIAMGRPDLPTSGLFPFNGLIQDVAYYSPALGVADVQNHFTLGSKPPG